MTQGLSLVPISTQKPLDPADYEKWTDDEWEAYVKAGAPGKGDLVCSRRLQDRFMVWLFRDKAWAGKIKTFFTHEEREPCQGLAVARYRLVFGQELLEFDNGDEIQTIVHRLGSGNQAHLGYWTFDTPRIKPYGEQLLVESHDVCKKIMQVIHLPHVFTSTVQNLLPSDLQEMTLEYLGYPSTTLVEETQITPERTNFIRQAAFTSFKQTPYLKQPYFSLGDPFRRIDGVDIPASLQKISGAIAEYVGDEDTAEKN